jgi:hypothetical protein
VVVPSSATCPPGTIGDPGDPNANPPVPPNFNATCKSASDPHQAAGPGRRNQLAYYSNYGPRIDLAGPGGARKFNLPNFDRGGTPGFPYTSEDLTNVWEDVNLTSNFATQIPCFVFTAAPGSRRASATRPSRAPRWPPRTWPARWPCRPAPTGGCASTRRR